MTASSASARYAVYYTPPPDSALWSFGCRVIGHDSCDPAGTPPPSFPELATVLSPAHQAEPARYGFHATLRAPFEMNPAYGVDDLLDLARDFARTRKPVPIGALQVTRLSGFVALVCTSAPQALAELAESCVRCFEPVRAPLSQTDRARRLSLPLTPRQRGHLDAWGYPYVLDEFTFHMTLTGRLGEATGKQALAALTALHAPLSAPVTIDAITVLEQTARSSPFRVVGRFPFTATSG